MALFRANTRERSGCVDQRNNRQPKLFREPHQAKRFAVALGVSTAEIPFHIFLRIAAFLMRDHGATVLPEFCQTARHRFVISESAITVQFKPISEATSDIVERERARDMTRQ